MSNNTKSNTKKKRNCKKSLSYNDQHYLDCTWLHTTDGKLVCGQDVNGRRKWDKCEKNCPAAIQWYKNTLVFANVNVYGVMPTLKCKNTQRKERAKVYENNKFPRYIRKNNASANKTFWCCMNVDIDGKGDINTDDAICSQSVCKILPQTPITETNVVQLTTVISVAVVTIFLSLFALIGYCIKKEKCKRSCSKENETDGEQTYLTIHPKTSENKIENNDVSKEGDHPPPDILSHSNDASKISRPIYELGQYLYNGNIESIDPTLSLNEQFDVFSYVPKLELNRKNFSVSDELLGAGNFGKVFKGEATGLFYPESKTAVAIKTINNVCSKNEVESLLCEIKILSNISLHFNLVNMMGACTTSPGKHTEMWLLLEFCELGDMKTFMKQNYKELEKCFVSYKRLDKINNRFMIKWAYDIAKGMEYLTSKHVMHGDLAARNILLSGGKDGHLIAKISDFGLSKGLYTTKYYKKMKRKYVPWKWMAYEFLDNGKFQLKSDVWSYCVVVWEIFSLGEEPYERLGFDDVLSKLKDGYYLPCPKRVYTIKNWRASGFYEYLARRCFKIDAKERSSFAELAEYIKGRLYNEELNDYKNDRKKYLNKCNLLLDDATRQRLYSTQDRRGLSFNSNGKRNANFIKS